MIATGRKPLLKLCAIFSFILYTSWKEIVKNLRAIIRNAANLRKAL